MPTTSRNIPRTFAGRSTTWSLVLGTALVAAACGPTVQVRTQAAPDANLAVRHTFRIMPTPAARGVSLDPNDPMLDNSITNRQIREDIRAAFEARGYVPNPTNPDVTIAYYATTQARYELTTWDYGYTWRGWPREWTEATPYEQGTVLIDVVDANTKELLWRGRGVAAVSTDPNAYERELTRAVNDIVKKYPAAKVATP
jgi:hypothetical protein